MLKFKVTFLPDNITVSVEKDATILRAALSAQIYINAACGGDGICGKCKVIVKGQVSSQPNGMITP
ncbi:MAG: ferredoxin, partial [Candidatus Pacebacteria bacterium CG_4_10_14_0_8_um_filter_42_14]